jgi:hypothetical protein
VELLIAAAMMSVLFVGLGAHLRGGLIVWQQATQRSEAVQRQRALFDRLDRDLAGAFIYDSRSDAYGDQAGLLPPQTFGDETLTLYTIEPSAQGLPSVRVVRYACDEQDGVRGVWRSSQTIGAARAKAEPPAELLLQDCEALAFEYAYLNPKEREMLIWGPMDDPEALVLPRLVRAAVTLERGERLERTCLIPAGRLPEPSAS